MEVSEIVAKELLKQRIIEDEDFGKYKFGIKVLLADMVNFIGIILIGFIFKQMIYSLVYILTFCGVRKFSGGFHAKTTWLCRTMTIGILIATIIITDILEKFSIYISVICVIITLLTMMKLSPIVNPNRILTEYEIKANRVMSILTTAIFSVLSLSLSVKGYAMGLYIAVVLFAIAILMHLEKYICRKGG